MLALPRTPTHQDDRHCRVGNEFVADFCPRRIDLQLRVYVPVSDRLVDNVRAHVLRKQRSVLPILLMEAHEHFVSRRCHSLPLFSVPCLVGGLRLQPVHTVPFRESGLSNPFPVFTSPGKRNGIANSPWA